MKTLIYGQATGGNALTWFNFFNRNAKKFDVRLLARTVCTLEHDFPVYKPYGRKDSNNLLGKIRKKIASSALVKLYLFYLAKFYKPDVVILQGNYTPKANLNVIRQLECKSILNIYGSDFYRKYKKNEFSHQDRVCFVEVLDKVNIIMCNWKGTYDDFIAEFPEYTSKTHLVPWGIDPDWSVELPKKELRPEKKFISTRALHSYNNVDMVVEAFCQAFPYPSKNSLHIIGAYGNDDKVVKKIRSSIDRNKMGDRVNLQLDKWYEGDELIQLYDGADYNLCFGSTDQLTISISYAFSRCVVNILSPLSNYEYLLELGYSTPRLSSEITVESLVELFNEVDSNLQGNPDDLISDRNRALQMFDMEKTFSSYLDLVS